MDAPKTKFIEKITSANAYNAFRITREQNEVKNNRLLDLKNDHYRENKGDYRLLNKCDVLTVTIEGIKKGRSYDSYVRRLIIYLFCSLYQ
jgi:hypothetical protein